MTEEKNFECEGRETRVKEVGKVKIAMEKFPAHLFSKKRLDQATD